MYKKKLKTDKTQIDTNNKFDILCDEIPQFSMITKVKEEARSKTHRQSKRCPPNKIKKVNKMYFKIGEQTGKCYGLKYFESKNRFAVLENNNEQSVDQIIDREIEISKS